MSESVIQVENLIKKYRKSEKNAVDNISFDVKYGEFFALLGPNGAGKTTTISMLTTTLAKTSGKVTVAGFDLDTNPSDVRQQIGVIFQNHSLDENLTAEENVRFHAVLYGLYKYRPTFSLMPRKYQDKVHELAEVIGIKNEIFDKIKSFSGGMKRKLEIIRSLIHNPKVLFLDEPTSGLDPVSRKNLWSYLTHVRETENTTIFLTTHYLEEAEDASRICIINEGKIVSIGTPGELKSDLVENYLILDAADQAKLKSELDHLSLDHSETAPYTVHIGSKNPQDVIKSIETQLTTLKIHSPTIEEAYLEIINKTETHAT